jgi:hypothetical protein
MKPLKSLHCCNYFSNVMDTAEILDLFVIAFSSVHDWHGRNNFSAISDSAVSMLPLKPFQLCKWHCWYPYDSEMINFLRMSTIINHFVSNFRGVSVIPLKWFRAITDTAEMPVTIRNKNFSGVNDTAVMVSEVSMTELKQFQQCQLHHWNNFSSVNDTAEFISHRWNLKQT